MLGGPTIGSKRHAAAPPPASGACSAGTTSAGGGGGVPSPNGRPSSASRPCGVSQPRRSGGDRHDAGWVDVPVDLIVVPLDVVEVNRVAEAGGLDRSRA